METEITTGMRVIRKEASSKPTIGIVKSLIPCSPWDRNKKPRAEVQWQDATLRIGGGTTTTSTIAVDSLLLATPENIEACIAKSKALTPVMKAALKFWAETWGDSYLGTFEGAGPICDAKKRWSYGRAFEKLARLGYLEPSPENEGKGSSQWVYRVSVKGKEALS